MQLPSSEKSYMPTLVNAVMNGSDATMLDAKMVEKVGVATIVLNKATWPVTVQKVDRHPEDEIIGNQGPTHQDEIKVKTKKKHPHGSLIIKDSIATKMKAYLFEEAFPKRNVTKIFDNSTS